MEVKFKSNNIEETLRFSSILAKFLSKGDVLVMKGDLGAGKTAFAKGIGAGLGIKETIISPTFNIVRCYFDSIIPFYHIDAYRLEGLKSDIGLEEYLYGNGICLIEWPEYIDYLLPKESLVIEIIILEENTREYKLISNSSHYDEVLKEMKSCIA